METWAQMKGKYQNEPSKNVEGRGWIHLAQDTEYWLVLVNTIKNTRSYLGYHVV
jgi:hypothetical protein